MEGNGAHEFSFRRCRAGRGRSRSRRPAGRSKQILPAAACNLYDVIPGMPRPTDRWGAASGPGDDMCATGARQPMTNDQFGTMMRRLDAIDARFDGIDARLQEVRGRLASVEKLERDVSAMQLDVAVMQLDVRSCSGTSR